MCDEIAISISGELDTAIDQIQRVLLLLGQFLNLRKWEAGLPIVSASEAHLWDLDVLDHCRVSLGELLEGERPMSEQLRRDRSRGLDLDAHRRHLED